MTRLSIWFRHNWISERVKWLPDVVSKRVSSILSDRYRYLYRLRINTSRSEVNFVPLRETRWNKKKCSNDSFHFVFALETRAVCMHETFNRWCISSMIILLVVTFRSTTVAFPRNNASHSLLNSGTRGNLTAKVSWGIGELWDCRYGFPGYGAVFRKLAPWLRHTNAQCAESLIQLDKIRNELLRYIYESCCLHFYRQLTHFWNFLI